MSGLTILVDRIIDLMNQQTLTGVKDDHNWKYNYRDSTASGEYFYVSTNVVPNTHVGLKFNQLGKAQNETEFGIIVSIYHPNDGTDNLYFSNAAISLNTIDVDIAFRGSVSKNDGSGLPENSDYKIDFFPGDQSSSSTYITAGTISIERLDSGIIGKEEPAGFFQIASECIGWMQDAIINDPDQTVSTQKSVSSHDSELVDEDESISINDSIPENTMFSCPDCGARKFGPVLIHGLGCPRVASFIGKIKNA